MSVLNHEYTFYELMWQDFARENAIPKPVWLRLALEKKIDSFDSGLFPSKEAALSSNHLYRYWNMISVKDHKDEILIGQCGEIEPVYDQYAISFFVQDNSTGELFYPQNYLSFVKQSLKNDYIPIVTTLFEIPDKFKLTQTSFATLVDVNDKKQACIVKLKLENLSSKKEKFTLFANISPVGLSGFQRRDTCVNRYVEGNRINHLKLNRTQNNLSYLQINSTFGPVFESYPDVKGIYGNDLKKEDILHYVYYNPYIYLKNKQQLNDSDEGEDSYAGFVTGVCGWDNEMEIGSEIERVIYIPADDFRGDDILAFHNCDADVLSQSTEIFWTQKLTQSGLIVSNSNATKQMQEYNDLFKVCRSNLLMLADRGKVHPGPTIYDDFWIRDSAVEGVALTMVGDDELARTQFSSHYTEKFNKNRKEGFIVGSSCKYYGFFGGEHEIIDREWDANGQALWAFGRYDKLVGYKTQFGLSMFSPYIIEGARWLRDNRSAYGLLHSGWSAEHLGDKEKPHFWDDLWAIAGLYEVGMLSRKYQLREEQEIWNIFDDFKHATANSIRYVLREQRNLGQWQTFIPTGPADVNHQSSDMIGNISYFHPLKLYQGEKLGADIDYAFRQTLETIWNHFMHNGGFFHSSAWNAYGPYLTIQLAHCFLYLGDVQRMNQCLNWAMQAGSPAISLNNESIALAIGAWNEQHPKMVQENFAEIIDSRWYMGDIPHGWAAADFLLLIRDMILFEVETHDPHIYLFAGLDQDKIKDSKLDIKHIVTIFGFSVDLTYEHKSTQNEIIITKQTDDSASNSLYYVYKNPFGVIKNLTVDNQVGQVSGNEICYLPYEFTEVIIKY